MWPRPPVFLLVFLFFWRGFFGDFVFFFFSFSSNPERKKNPKLTAQRVPPSHPQPRGQLHRRGPAVTRSPGTRVPRLRGSHALPPLVGPEARRDPEAEVAGLRRAREAERRPRAAGQREAEVARHGRRDQQGQRVAEGVPRRRGQGRAAEGAGRRRGGRGRRLGGGKSRRSGGGRGRRGRRAGRQRRERFRLCREGFCCSCRRSRSLPTTTAAPVPDPGPFQVLAHPPPGRQQRGRVDAPPAADCRELDRLGRIALGLGDGGDFLPGRGVEEQVGDAVGRCCRCREAQHNAPAASLSERSRSWSGKRRSKR